MNLILEILNEAQNHPSFQIALNESGISKKLALAIWGMGYITAIYDMENEMHTYPNDSQFLEILVSVLKGYIGLVKAESVAKEILQKIKMNIQVRQGDVL